MTSTTTETSLDLDPIITIVVKAAADLAELSEQSTIEPKRLRWLADHFHTASGELLEAADKAEAALKAQES